MGFIEWSDQFELGIEEVDNQHKRLIQLTNELHTAMSEGNAQEFLGELLHQLALYAVSHFATEERLMRQYSYPESEPHIDAHRMFVEKVGDFENGLTAHRFFISIDILNFLKNWIRGTYSENR